MPEDAIAPKSQIVPYVGAAIVGAALIFRPLRFPLALGCLVALGNAALSHSSAEQPKEIVPETPPPSRPRRSRARRDGNDTDTVSETSEDSFPASDPPAWTPVSGTGTQH